MCGKFHTCIKKYTQSLFFGPMPLYYMDMESLKKPLDKAAKEEGIAGAEQLLHIDEKDSH